VRVEREVRLYTLWCAMCPEWGRTGIEESRTASIAAGHEKRKSGCLVHRELTATVRR
jgi:hypothetical protein